MSELLFSLIFGHFLADFLFQTNKINDLKNSEELKKRIKALLIHVLVHFITYIAVTLIFHSYSKKLVLIMLLISLFHLCIDIAKTEINRIPGVKSSIWYSSLTYIGDQIAHIVTIVFILQIFNFTAYTWEDTLKFVDTFLLGNNTITKNFSGVDKLCLIGSAIIFNTYFCAYLLEIILKPLKPNNSSFVDSKLEKKSSTSYKNGEVTTEYVIEHTNVQNDYQEPPTQVGKYIGMSERILIMFLIAGKAFTAITFLVTIKALTRFKQFDDKCFAEYYLIGSLLSVLFGTISGYFVILVFK